MARASLGCSAGVFAREGARMCAGQPVGSGRVARVNPSRAGGVSGAPRAASAPGVRRSHLGWRVLWLWVARARRSARRALRVA